MQQHVVSADPLEHDTTLFADVRVALRLLGCTYSEYMQRTTPWERRLIFLWLTLEQAKIEHAEAKAVRDREAAQAARQGMGPTGR